MAKKNVAASAEDRLAAALVPAEEQPYPVPENWVWAHGFAFLRPMESTRPSGERFSYIDIDSVDNRRQVVTQPKKLLVSQAPSRASRMTHPGDTIFSMVRPYLKNIAYIDDSLAGVIASTGFFVCSPRSNVDSKYNYYMMTTKYVVDGLNTFMRGDNSPSIRADEILSFLYPLPPLPEQHRIVDRITSLFAKLEEAKEEAQAIIDGYEDWKAAILHRAFTGELTEDWRKNNKILLESWNTTPLVNLCVRIFDGPFGSNLKSDDYVESGVRVVRLENLKNLWFDDSKQSFVTEEKYHTIEAHTVFPTDLIMSTFIADEIKVCQMPEYIGYAVNKADCIGIRVADSADKLFVLYYLSSKQTYNHLFSQLHGATRPRVNTKQIKAIPVPIPTLSEQHEIVRRLDVLLRHEADIKSAAEDTLAQIATLRQSILARAFRGELGTNDPTDEPAIELLKRTLKG